MANPVQQGLKHDVGGGGGDSDNAEMANPVQQGLKQSDATGMPVSYAKGRNG